MNRLTGLLISTVILSGGALAGCAASTKTFDPASSSGSTNPPPPVAVRAVEAMPSVVSGDLLIPASLSVEGTAIVLAQRDGTIIKLQGQEGQRIAKGEIIAQLGGDEDLREQLRQAELEVNRLKVEEREYEALIKVNRNELERETQLAKEGLASQRDIERAQFRLDAAVLELEKTRVASQAAQSKVEGVKVELEKTTVRSPISGIITRRFAKLGTGVVKNDKLFEVTQVAPLEVKFQLPQTERGRLGPGSVVSLSLVDTDQIVASARIRRVDPVADAASNTLGYLADVSSGPGLMPGLAVNVRVPRTAVGSTLWIPQTAFPPGSELRSGMAGTVLIVDGDKCAARGVWINAVQGDQVEIISGLNAGDRVILSPPAGLKAGDIVEVKN
ncbi:MAG TPA: efflux RND transporter periplasmic adaptor subunit [Pyrinomonadaceae bacterium]|nr:efflux RND transporter periplasmic adaptor subunit [Pyrinomonadaceae bacterium]